MVRKRGRRPDDAAHAANPPPFPVRETTPDIAPGDPFGAGLLVSELREARDAYEQLQSLQRIKARVRSSTAQPHDAAVVDDCVAGLLAFLFGIYEARGSSALRKTLIGLIATVEQRSPAAAALCGQGLADRFAEAIAASTKSGGGDGRGHGSRGDLPPGKKPVVLPPSPPRAMEAADRMATDTEDEMLIFLGSSRSATASPGYCAREPSRSSRRPFTPPSMPPAAVTAAATAITHTSHFGAAACRSTTVGD